MTVNFSPGQVTTVVNRINREKSAQTVRDLPAFKKSIPSSAEEWSKFNLKDEYAKMGVPNGEWKLTDLNENFGLCDTYDTVLVFGIANFFRIKMNQLTFEIQESKLINYFEVT